MKEQLLPMAEGNKEIEGFINNVLTKHIIEYNTNESSLALYEHIIDYLKSGKAPKRLRKMSFEQAQRKAEEWTKSLQKKGANIVETEQDIEVIKAWKDGSGFKFVKLTGEAAFKREGHLMRHCVGSYYGKEDVSIFSLRDSNNNPHCTIELVEKNGYIQQIKGKGNGPIHPKYIKYVLKMLKKLGQDVNENELQYLGYVTLSKELWELLDTCFSNVKDLTFKNKRLYYKHSTPVLAIDRDKAVKIAQKLLKRSK